MNKTSKFGLTWIGLFKEQNLVVGRQEAKDGLVACPLDET